MSIYIVLSTVSLAVACLLWSPPIFAQQTSQAPSAQQPTDTLVTIATGNKFQQILPENNSGKDRRALVIENKNTNGDSCWVFVGTGEASKEESDQILAPGDEYIKYWPFVPADEIQATCASSSDTLSLKYK